MPFDGTQFSEVLPARLPDPPLLLDGAHVAACCTFSSLFSDRVRHHMTRHHLSPATPSTLTAEEQNRRQQNFGHADTTWSQLSEKAKTDDKLCENAVEQQLKEAAAHAIALLFAGGMEKHTDPAIMRALMREMLQEVHRFRTELKTGNITQSSLNAEIGQLSHRIRKRALIRNGQLSDYHMNLHERGEAASGKEGLTCCLNLNSHHGLLSDSPHAWLSTIDQHSHLAQISSHHH